MFWLYIAAYTESKGLSALESLTNQIYIRAINKGSPFFLRDISLRTLKPLPRFRQSFIADVPLNRWRPLSMSPSSLLILVNALRLIRPRATPAPVMMTDGNSMEILYLLVPHEDKTNHALLPQIRRQGCARKAAAGRLEPAARR